MILIDSNKLYNAYMHGAEYVMQYKSILNKINVFPVADGDTGNNLHATMHSIIKESKVTDSVKKTLESIADASLGGARGNSGIIFSQFLNGVSIEIAGDEKVSMEDFVLANKKSVEYAYSAVSNPVEGTMLTVIREWADSLFDFHKRAESFQELLTHGYKVIEKSLKKTKNQLSVLRRAGVVDSGAKGFVLFIKGFMDAIVFGKKAITVPIDEESNVITGEMHHNTEHRYCVEAKIEGCTDIGSLRQSLINLGSSLIVAGNKRVARVHIHSNQPSEIFNIISSNENILHQKVDDMKRQSEMVSDRKYKIALVTDSIADIPSEYIDENQIYVVPINILMDGTEYLDKVTIENSRIIAHIDSDSEFPTTSQPDQKYIENLLFDLSEYYDSIIVITVASVLSGTYNAFKKAALKIPNEKTPVSVIDSKTNSGAQGLLVNECVQKIKSGSGYKKIVSDIEELVSDSEIIVSVSNLTNMIKGGRLSTKAGKIAEKLNLKPIVTLDKDGRGTLGGAAFSQKGSRKKLLKKIVKLDKKDRLKSYSVVYVDDENYAKSIASQIETITGLKAEFITQSSSVIAVSAGKGAVALSYIRK